MRLLPLIVALLFLTSGIIGMIPDGEGLVGGASSTEDRSPQIYRVDDSGGTAFRTIQAAIDAASPGDFVRVHAGSYVENITIDKGIHLIGNGSDTRIWNDGTRDVVTVLASPFTIKGFNIAGQSNYSSIKLYYVDNGLIENCHIRGSGIIYGNGIRGDDGCNNISIINNIFDQNGDQAILLGGDRNLIEANSFYLNHIGVSIHGNGNRIVNNTFEESDYGVRLGHFSQDVLLMGNSYTFANSLDDIVEGQLDTITIDAVVTELAQGGLTLSDHGTRVQTSGHTWNTTLNNDRSWEAIVLQDQSQIPGFPTAQTSWQRSMSAARVLDAMIERRGADTVFLMTWGRRDGDSTNPGLYPNFTVMQARLEAGYGYYAENLSTEDRPAYIAPAGLAFKHVHDDIIDGGGDPTAPGTMFHDLYSGDGSHPSRQGSYLASCVLYATLTGNTPVGLQDGVPINALRKLALQEAAAATVFNETPSYEYPWRRSSGNLVDGNTFEVKGTGLTIGCNAGGNTVRNNSFSDGNGPGVLVRDSNSHGNVIHHNGFRKNGQGLGQARDDWNGNAWNYRSEGNYWDDYSSRYPGATNDGVVWDTPYDIIGGGADRYPLVRFPDFEDYDPPQAAAGPDRTQDEDTLIKLDGRWSYDEVGIVNYTWTFVYEGEAVALYGPQVEFQFDMPGVYNVTLNVTDEAGNWGVDNVILTILDTTRPIPVMTQLGPVDQHESFILDGSRSHDNVGIVNWTWRLIADHRTVYLYGEVVELVVDTVGDYQVYLTVFDAASNNRTDDMYFTVRDIDPPVADAGPDLTINQGQFATFDGSGSSDNVYSQLSYVWTIEDGDGEITLKGRDVDHQFMYPGIFRITLTVTDLSGNTANDTLNVTVSDIEPPLASAGALITVKMGDLVTLDATNSTDNVGIILYLWTFEYDGSPVEVEGEVLRYTFDIMGGYDIMLTVFDDAGLSSNDIVDVTVLDGVPPVADAGSDLTVGQGVMVSLDGSNSTDNRAVVNWSWTFSHDGEDWELDDKVAAFRFDVPGDYTITLTVRDRIGLSDEDSIQLHVVDTEPPVPPKIEGKETNIGWRVEMVASGGMDNVGIVKWTWTFEDDGRTVVLDGREVEYRFDEAGEHVVVLTVEDAAGNSADESFTVDVTDSDKRFYISFMIALAIVTALTVFWTRHMWKKDKRGRR